MRKNIWRKLSKSSRRKQRAVAVGEDPPWPARASLDAVIRGRRPPPGRAALLEGRIIQIPLSSQPSPQAGQGEDQLKCPQIPSQIPPSSPSEIHHSLLIPLACRCRLQAWGAHVAHSPLLSAMTVTAPTSPLESTGAFRWPCHVARGFAQSHELIPRLASRGFQGRG